MGGRALRACRVALTRHVGSGPWVVWSSWFWCCWRSRPSSWYGRRNRQLAAERAARELEPVKKLAFEDVTALGVELQDSRPRARRDGSSTWAPTPTTSGRSTPTRRPRPRRTGSSAPSRCRTSPRSSTTGATRSPASAPASPASRFRSDARPASSTRGTGCRSRTCLRAGGRSRAQGAGLRPGRRAGRGGRRAGRPSGDGRHPAGAVLAGRSRLPAVRRGLLRRVRPARLDLHGVHVRHAWATGSAGWPSGVGDGMGDAFGGIGDRPAGSATASVTSSTDSTSDVGRASGAAPACGGAPRRRR